VVLSEREARRKWKLPLDHDDTHVWKYDKDFAILIHGTQPKGSKAGKAWYQLCKVKKTGGYKSEYFKHYVSDGKGGKCKKSALVPIVSIPASSGSKVIAHKWVKVYA
jgi:hypothetical protein